MKFLLLLALALFFVISVEGKLRGDRGHDDESRALQECKKGGKKGTFAKLQSVSTSVAVAFSWWRKGLVLT
jgi:hypothetical protein